MVIFVAAAVTAFVIAFLAIPVVIRFAISKNLMDVPGRRKIHKKETPSLGGIAIFLGFFVSTLIWIDLSELKNIKFILVPFVVIFFTGLRDDLVDLKPWIKLLGQILAAGFLLFLLDVRLHSFYGLFGIEEWPPLISYAVTVFTIIVIVNSFNLVDGIDGLAGGLGLTSLLFFGVWYLLVGDVFLTVLCFSMIGAIAAFLIFNWEPSKIFMGDTGSMIIGLLIAILTLRFINFNYNLAEDNPLHFDSTVTTATCIIFVPLFDTLRIVLLRLWKGQSPFTPDKSHIHHTLLRLGLNHSRSTVALIIIQLLFILAATALRNVGDRIMMPSVLAFAIILSITLDRLVARRFTPRN